MLQAHDRETHAIHHSHAIHYSLFTWYPIASACTLQQGHQRHHLCSGSTSPACSGRRQQAPYPLCCSPSAGMLCTEQRLPLPPRTRDGCSPAPCRQQAPQPPCCSRFRGCCALNAMAHRRAEKSSQWPICPKGNRAGARFPFGAFHRATKIGTPSLVLPTTHLCYSAGNNIVLGGLYL